MFFKVRTMAAAEAFGKLAGTSTARWNSSIRTLLFIESPFFVDNEVARNEPMEDSREFDQPKQLRNRQRQSQGKTFNIDQAEVTAAALDVAQIMR